MRKYALAATGLAAAALLGGSATLASTMASASTAYTVSAIQYGSTTPISTPLNPFHSGNSAAVDTTDGTAVLTPGTTGFSGVNLGTGLKLGNVPEPVFKSNPSGPTLYIRVFAGRTPNGCTIEGKGADSAGDPLDWTVLAGGVFHAQTSWANAEAYAAGISAGSVCTPASVDNPLETIGFIAVNGAVAPTPSASASATVSASPTPTASSSSSPVVIPSVPTGVVPSGGVKTGGGIPAPSPWLPVGYALIALGLVLATSAFVLNKKNI